METHLFLAVVITLVLLKLNYILGAPLTIHHIRFVVGDVMITRHAPLLHGSHHYHLLLR